MGKDRLANKVQKLLEKKSEENEFAVNIQKENMNKNTNS